jgi:phosphate ABC transporter, permease protein PstA
MDKRHIEQYVFIGICGVAGLITAISLFVIIGSIFIMGLPSLNLDFILSSEHDTEGWSSAIGNAIIGTIYIAILSVVISAPFAIGTAIYLKEYAPDNIITRIFRFLIEVLAGTPSIVIGVFGLLIIVVALKPLTGGFSLLSGSIALAILIMPLIEKSVEDALNTVPEELEHGSYALGATQWDTIKKIIVPYSMSGIITGVIMGIGRSAEESAVVMLTAGYSQFFPEYAIKAKDGMLFDVKIYPVQDLVGTLPIAIYHAYEYMGRVPISTAFATAFVLIVIVMIINLSARAVMTTFKTDRPKRSGPSRFFPINKLLPLHKKGIATVQADGGSPPQIRTSTIISAPEILEHYVLHSDGGAASNNPRDTRAPTPNPQETEAPDVDTSAIPMKWPLSSTIREESQNGEDMMDSPVADDNAHEKSVIHTTEPVELKKKMMLNCRQLIHLYIL